jgi:hypothetical protein
LRGWGGVYLLYLLACALQYRYLDNIGSDTIASINASIIFRIFVLIISLIGNMMMMMIISLHLAAAAAAVLADSSIAGASSTCNVYKYTAPSMQSKQAASPAMCPARGQTCRCACVSVHAGSAGASIAHESIELLLGRHHTTITSLFYYIIRSTASSKQQVSLTSYKSYSSETGKPEHDDDDEKQASLPEPLLLCA